MLDTLITSKTRIKLLLKFFLNPDNSAHLRGLESEFGESSNAIRLELNRFEESKMLKSSFQGNKKVFQVNQHHVLYNEINAIVKKYLKLDLIIDRVAKNLGHLEAVYIMGELAKGRDTEVIDLLMIGHIDRIYLSELIFKAENLINKKIRYLIYSKKEFFHSNYSEKEMVLLWKKD